MRTSHSPGGFRERARQAGLSANIVILQEGKAGCRRRKGGSACLGLVRHQPGHPPPRPFGVKQEAELGSRSAITDAR